MNMKRSNQLAGGMTGFIPSFKVNGRIIAVFWILAISCRIFITNCEAATFNVTSGMKFTVAAADAGKETFDSAPKIYAERPGRKINVRIIEKRSSFPIKKVTCVWLDNSPAKQYTLKLQDGSDTPVVISDDFNVKAPEIYSYYPSRAETGDIVTLKGRYFGMKFNAWLETDSGRKVECGVLKPYKYPDWKGKPGKSVMNPKTGRSLAKIRINGQSTTADTCVLHIDNKIGSCQASYSKTEKKWTILVYADGDNNLDSDLIKEFESMARIGSTENINVVVQLDRAEGTDNHGEYGGWTITNRFYVTEGMEPTQENAVTDWEDGQGGGREADMSVSKTLRSFINWGTVRYPAEKFLLVISDHGFGWRGLCLDDTSGESSLYIKDVRKALNNVRRKRKMDLLFLSDCLMQNLEASYELKDCGPEYLVASEAPFSPGYPYDDLLSELSANPEMTELDLAKMIVDLYAEANAASTYYTLSAVELAEVGDFLAVFKKLVLSMYDGSDMSVVRANAAAVMTQLETTAVYSKAGGQTAACRGMTVYFPELMYVSGIPMPIPPNDYQNFYNNKMLAFPNASNWKIFLDCFLNQNPQYQVPTEIHAAREGLELYNSGMVDIYRFCDNIVNSECGN